MIIAYLTWIYDDYILAMYSSNTFKSLTLVWKYIME